MIKWNKIYFLNIMLWNETYIYDQKIIYYIIWILYLYPKIKINKIVLMTEINK